MRSAAAVLDSARRARVQARLPDPRRRPRPHRRAARAPAGAGRARERRGGVEVFEGDACTPEAVADALAAMTFAIGRRFMIVDGVERWKEADVEPLAAGARGRRPRHYRRLLRPRGRPRQGAGGAGQGGRGGRRRVAEESHGQAARAAALGRGEAQELGLELDDEAARALSPSRRPPAAAAARAREARARARPGRRDRRRGDRGVLRESAERKVWTLADALVAGDRRARARAPRAARPGRAAARPALRMVRRLREALEIAEPLDAGEPPAQIKKGLRMPASPPTA